ncbi:MAG: outer membrane lipoprotein-sorting protein [Myxococcota bacterium]
MRYEARVLALALWVLGPPLAAGAEAPSVDEIVARTNRVAYYQGDDGRARVKMTITDAQGRERLRRFTILRRDQERGEAAAAGDQKMYVYFRRPPDVNKMAFLVWKHPGQDDDRWLYLPALDLVKRIAAADERTSFVGSHFFYEDVSGRSPEEDHHELRETTENYYVLRHTPKKPEAVEFAHYDMWVHRGSFIPVKMEYVDASGSVYRRYEALEVKTVQGHPTVVRARMSDLRGGGDTLLEYDAVAYDVGVPEDVFSERYLRQPPTEYLR